DLGKRGALATLSYVIPFDVLAGRRFLVSGGGDGGMQFDIEASYYYPLTDNIALIPSFYVIENANNFNDNPAIFVGAVRTQFSF
ncbi:carbohydrate porin, partial [Planktothrix sp. FACHB-1355]